MTDPQPWTGGSSATHATAAERRRAGWILAGVSVSLSTVILIWTLQGPSEFLTERLGVNAQAGQIGWAWMLALIVAAGYSWYTIRSVPLVNEHKLKLDRLKLLGICAALGSGVVEEVVFRQILMDAVADRGGSVFLQVLLSAALFGIVHGLWGFLGGEWRIAVPVMTATAILGAALAVVYLVADRNVLPAVAAHTTINLVIEPWLILAAVSGRFIARDHRREAISGSDSVPGSPGLGITVVGVLAALCCIGFAGVNVFFETTGRFAGGPYAEYASGFAVMNWLVVGLKVMGAAVALLTVAHRPRFVRPVVVGVLVWGAFATLGLYSLGSMLQVVGMISGLSGSIDQIDVASVSYLVFFLLIAASFGILAISYSRRYDLRRGAAVLGMLGAPVLLAMILFAIPGLLAAAGVMPGL